MNALRASILLYRYGPFYIANQFFLMKRCQGLSARLAIRVGLLFVSLTSTVPSMGIPRSGLAPDVKRGVLNSHVLINGQKFPSLASSDSESPTDDLEVGFPVELR